MRAIMYRLYMGFTGECKEMKEWKEKKEKKNLAVPTALARHFPRVFDKVYERKVKGLEHVYVVCLER